MIGLHYEAAAHRPVLASSVKLSSGIPCKVTNVTFCLNVREILFANWKRRRRTMVFMRRPMPSCQDIAELTIAENFLKISVFDTRMLFLYIAIIFRHSSLSIKLFLDPVMYTSLSTWFLQNATAVVC